MKFFKRAWLENQAQKLTTRIVDLLIGASKSQLEPIRQGLAGVLCFGIRLTISDKLKFERLLAESPKVHTL